MNSGLRRDAIGAAVPRTQPAAIDKPACGASPSADKYQIEYLPIVSTRTGALTGAEALTRWNAKPDERAMLDFETLFDGGCADLARWQCCTPGSVALSIDISPDQLLDDRFASVVARGIRRHGIRPARVSFELREPRDEEVGGILIARLSALRRMGVSIVLDDFGLKHSTLSSLIALPLNGVKFGRQFTASLPQDSTSAGILTSVVSLARDLGISVAIDGVENASQLAWLRRLGDLDAQGDLISGPLCSDALLYWLLRSSSLSAPLRRDDQPTRKGLTRMPAR
ncbi:MAG TPA: EAL domain-containing protein [Paraburkholderia sp.]|uniref:EAL domain-containing protein n=1 Tax=Paraburkholderia sp. TaxID=1926495 RepID=UPI002B485BB3|nr:EAL domain-containing protein [Paraburkholderia sp.]HKR45611.1 EAL domain-containing protein [Paraburkholderia sp.]